MHAPSLPVLWFSRTCSTGLFVEPSGGGCGSGCSGIQCVGGDLCCIYSCQGDRCVQNCNF